MCVLVEVRKDGEENVLCDFLAWARRRESHFTFSTLDDSFEALVVEDKGIQAAIDVVIANASEIGLGSHR